MNRFPLGSIVKIKKSDKNYRLVDAMKYKNTFYYKLDDHKFWVPHGKLILVKRAKTTILIKPRKGLFRVEVEGSLDPEKDLALRFHYVLRYLKEMFPEINKRDKVYVADTLEILSYRLANAVVNANNIFLYLDRETNKWIDETDMGKIRFEVV